MARFRTKKLKTVTEMEAQEPEPIPVTLPLTQPLLIRLRQDIGHVPAGITVELPKPEALSLIRRGHASVVGDLNATPALYVSEDDVDIALHGSSGEV